MTSEARLQRRRRALAAALAVAAATTLLTGLAHSLAGGTAPDALLLASGFTLTLIALAPVLGARRSLPRQLVAIAAAQLVQHVLYSLPTTAVPAAGPAGGAHAAHAHGAVALGSASVHEHAGMPLAHVAAGIATFALLRLAPRAVDALLEAMSPRLAAATLTGTGPRARRTASVTSTSPARRRTLDALVATLGTRGPPAAFV